MGSKTGKAFDLQIFLRLMSFAKHYKLNFFIATISTILLALVSLINPYLVKETVDKYISEKDTEGLVNNVMLMFGVVFSKYYCVLYLSILQIGLDNILLETYEQKLSDIFCNLKCLISIKILLGN